MSVFSSGYLRNRFRVSLSQQLRPEGFIYDYTRMPGKEIDNGFGVDAGSIYDPNNSLAKTSFRVFSTSGYLQISDYKSHLSVGFNLNQAGVAHESDCYISGILTSGTRWDPIIKTGVLFNKDTDYYLYSDSATDIIVSGSDLRSVINNPKNYTPISLASYWIDKYSNVYTYERFEQKVKFTSTSDTITAASLLPDVNGFQYDLSYSGINWQVVDSGIKEFMLDRSVPQIVRNQNIVSGVSAKLTRVPWASDKFQLPLLPIVNVQNSTLHIYEEPILISGITALKFSGLGATSNHVVLSGFYVRISGLVTDTATTIISKNQVSGIFPGIGNLLITDGNNRYERIGYSTISGLYTFSGLTRTTPKTHRDDAEARAIISGIALNGAVSGITYGNYLVNYDVAITVTPDPMTGLVTVPRLSGVPHAVLDINYIRGLLLTYEPTNANEYRTGDIDINPLLNGINHGIVWVSNSQLIPSRLDIQHEKPIVSGNIVGPIYAGNDFFIFNILARTADNTPVPGELITISTESTSNVGLINGVEASTGTISKVTDGAGIARFVYTPPQTIHGLGYFTSVGAIVNSSGLVFVEEFPLSEIYENGQWKTLTFSIWNDDYYNTPQETSGAFLYSADGRFEIVSKVTTAGSPTTYTLFSPVQPIAAYDSNGMLLTTSGNVKKLVYSSNELPTDSEIIAFFISAEKQITIGALASSGYLASNSLTLQIKLPAFMTGDFLFGPVNDPGTKAFDSISYLTINPFRATGLDESRFDPRELGNIFRVQGSKTNEYLRNKFYVVPNWSELSDTSAGLNEVNKQFTLRNRFILEVK